MIFRAHPPFLVAGPVRGAALLTLTLALTLTAAGGCGGPLAGDLDDTIGGLHQGLGQPSGGRPNHEERVALYTCNRARVEPATSAENDWSEYPAVPPLLWHDSLAKACRAHSNDMRDTPCFQHDSCDGTNTFERIKSFWRPPEAQTYGENIMAGINDGKTAIFNWIEEIGARPGERGHRDNMFSDKYTHVGFGYSTGGTRFQGYWTQDFAGGVGDGDPTPPLGCGIDFPATGSGGNRTFGTTYYSARKVKPTHVLLVLDGRPYEMQLVKGEAHAGAYEITRQVSRSCHRYYFSVIAAGVESNYPDKGTLGVDPGNLGTCAEYVAGPVGGVTLPPDAPKDTGAEAVEGGCRVGRAPAGNLLMLLVPLALLRRPRRRPRR